eukprot:g9967.t1
MSPVQISYPSVEFKNQLRDGVAPIEACAFNAPRREFIAVDASALRVWGLKRVIKTIMAPRKVSSPAIAAFCCEKDDIYIVVYGGRQVSRLGTQPPSPATAESGGCFVYDARLRFLCRFSPCDCEVTAKEIRPLEGPTKLLPMEILEIDLCSGLVAGMNGTEAFLWRLPLRQGTQLFPGNGLAPSDKAGIASGAEGTGRYEYLGSIPDLHSSEVTAISVREPLLATGLANGRIFLWRINPLAGDIKRTVLTVFDAHDAFPVLTLRLFRSGEAPNHEVTRSYSSPPRPAPVELLAPVPGEVGATPTIKGHFAGGSSRGGDATEDWTIVSGGGDGAVAHWSVVGLASSREVADGTEEAGVELQKIGDYEPMSSVRRPRDDSGFNPVHGDGGGGIGGVPVRRMRRVSAGGLGGGNDGGSAVEAAITALCSLSDPLVIAGDSDGRLDPANLGGALVPPRPKPPLEWVVSAGSGGEVRVWKVPFRWPDGGAASGGRRSAVGLEFCATLLTNSSVCSFSCVVLCPCGSARLSIEPPEQEGADEAVDGQGKRRKQHGRRAEAGTGGATTRRLFCVIGSDNGFVQAWELSLDGEKGVGGQPLWSQKVHDTAVTSMDTWEVPYSTLDGLNLLRRLNVACSPRGLPGALIVGTPVEGPNGGVEGTQLEAGVILAADRGELTQLGIKYKYGKIRSNRPANEPLVTSCEEIDEEVVGGERGSPKAPPAREHTGATGRQAQRSGSVQAGTTNYLDTIPKGYTPPLTSSQSGRHSASTPAGTRPRTTGPEMPGNRPLREPFLNNTVSAAPPSGRRDVPRSRSANHAGRTGRDQRNQQHGQDSRVAAAEDENDMVGRWEYASSEDQISSATASEMFSHAVTTSTGATASSAATAYSVGSTSQMTLASGSFVRHVDDQQGGAGRGGDLALATQRRPASSNEQEERRIADNQAQVQRLQPKTGVAVTETASAPDETQSLNDDGRGRRGVRGYKRMRADAVNIGGRSGKSSTGGDAGRLRCTQSCEGTVEQKKLKTGEVFGNRQPPRAKTKDGFVGDIGRWQQRMGITVESECSSGSSGLGDRSARESLRRPSSATVTTAKDLMEDSVLKEAFAARGRHKTSPVLAREVKAVLKTWAPGVLEACSRADFSAAMGGLGGGERVSFQRVCEIAAAVLASTGGRGRSNKGKTGRLSKYHNMAKVKTRLQYNSMGERVVVRTALDSIDAFATRSRQCSHPPSQQQQQQRRRQQQQQQQQKPRQQVLGEANADYPGEITEKLLQETGIPKAAGDGGANVEAAAGKTDPGGATWHPHSVSSGGLEDKVNGDEKDRHSEGYSLASGGLQTVSPPPPVPQTVSKSLGFGLPDFSSVGSKVVDSIYSEGVDENSLARPSRATAANLGDVPAGLRGVWSRQGSCLFCSWPASYHADTSGTVLPAEGTDGAAEVLGEGECVRAVRNVLDTRAAAEAAALVACRRHGRCPPDAHELIVGDANHDESALNPSFVEGGVGDASNPSSHNRCVASEVEPLGVILYKSFRRHYGLQRTAEERVAGLLGSILEHSPASAVLRLFARMLGVPAPADAQGGEGHWPLQTRSEDAKAGLEPQLADLVTTARSWLTTRGFLTTDGPLAGIGGSYNSGGGGSAYAGDSVGIGWRKTVVVRTHAAMCASALLKPGWGPGHQIMGAVEQAVLGLPTVVRGNGGRWTGQRGQQPWSECVDGEEFLETLLLVVLRARDTSSKTYDGLFGRRAVEGHSFLLAKARDINADAAAALAEDKKAADEAKKTVSERRLESLLDDIPKSPPSLLLTAPGSGERHRADCGAVSPTEASPTSTRMWRRENEVGDSSGTYAHGEGLAGSGDSKDVLSHNGERRGRATRFRDRTEELGEGGRVLKRTLPAEDFRRVLCEGHGGLWPDLAIPVRGAARVVIPEGSAADFVDPRLSSTENDAARALVRRFVDAIDGQACYLDVWITLYHAVFRSGKIVPFTELPGVCENQLRGADTDHWEALLDYFDTAGAGTATALPALHDGASVRGTGWLSGRGPRGGEIFDGESGTTVCRKGGASSSHTVGSRTSICRPRPGSAATKAPESSAPTPGIAAEWPRAGWGPGSLTVSGPPRAGGASETVRWTAAVMTAFAGSTDKVLRAQGDLYSSSGVGAGVRTHSLRQPQSRSSARPMMSSSSQPLSAEAWGSDGGDDGGQRFGEEEADGEFLATVKAAGDDGSRLLVGDGRKRASEDEGGSAARPPTEELVGMLLRTDGDTDVQDGGFKTDGSMQVESAYGERSGAGGNEGGESNGPDKGIPVRGEGAGSGHRGEAGDGGEHPQESSNSFEDEHSLSGGMLLMNLDCGTLEPPSPEPPSPEWRGDEIEAVGPEQEHRRGSRRKKKRREKRTMTSVYVRCPFLEPVKSKQTYRVPRGGRPNFPSMPVFHEAVDPAAMATQMYSFISSSKAKKAAADAAINAERQRLSSAAGRGWGRGAKGVEGGPLMLQFPPSLKEAMMREGRSKNRDRRREEAAMHTPGPGGAGGRLSEEAHQAAAEHRIPWTGQRQRRKGADIGTVEELPPEHGVLEEPFTSAAEQDSVLEGRDGFVLTGTVAPAGERPSSPAKKPPSSKDKADGGREASGGGCYGVAAKAVDGRRISGSEATEAQTPPAMPGVPGVQGARPGRGRGRGNGRGAMVAARRGRGGAVLGRRKGPETPGDSDDSDDSGDGGMGMDAKKAAQQKMIEDMMAEQAAKRRASGDAMKRLIEEEEERKRLRRAEEEAEREAQEKARQEMEERHRRELEERRRALAKKRAEVEEKNRQLEEERLRREAERQAADQARREATEARRQQEAAKRAEEERLAREERARWQKVEEERLQKEEEERARMAEETVRKAIAERERAREVAEQERMARHDEDVDIVIQANLAMVREAERVERAAQAAREAEELKNAAETAKRRLACLLMSKAEAESRLWNESWKMQKHVEKAQEVEVKKAKKRNRTRVTWDEHGNPVDIRLWEMECTSRTDADGRLVQRETYSNVDRDATGTGDYTFDPRDVFQGEGGGIGGRGGGRGDGTTPADPGEGEEGSGKDEAHLDAEGLLERERRWMEAIFAASRPDDLSAPTVNATGNGHHVYNRRPPSALEATLIVGDGRMMSRSIDVHDLHAALGHVYDASAAETARQREIKVTGYRRGKHENKMHSKGEICFYLNSGEHHSSNTHTVLTKAGKNAYTADVTFGYSQRAFVGEVVYRTMLPAQLVGAGASSSTPADPRMILESRASPLGRSQVTRGWEHRELLVKQRQEWEAEKGIQLEPLQLPVVPEEAGGNGNGGAIPKVNPVTEAVKELETALTHKDAGYDSDAEIILVEGGEEKEAEELGRGERCLFQDSTGSNKFNPDAFFPMVLSERVAWPEYMDMIRAALMKQAEAIIKQGAALEAGSSGGRAGAGEDGAAGRDGDVSSGSDVSRPGGQPGLTVEKAAAAAANAPARNEATAITPRPPSDCQAPDNTPAGTRQLEFGKTLRGTTIAGPESWALFYFNLPTAGPILTVVLDIADGDPDIVVSKRKLPSAGFGPEDSSATAVAAQAKAAKSTVALSPTGGRGRGQRDSTAAVGVPMVQGGGGEKDGEWKASSTYRGLRVVKILPRDTGYGPGEYFVGVVSKGIPARFALRVSAASPADEVSTHMRTAAAIVDNLAFMSKMNPHRLVKDFVGARLEAEETLRKQHAAALVDRAIEEPNPAANPSSPVGCHREEKDKQHHHHQHHQHGSSSNSHRQNSTPQHERLRSEQAPIELSALRRRERDLPSRVAVLDDRMMRTRPKGPLAMVTAKSSVSVSAVVSDSSPAMLASGPDPARDDEGATRLVDVLGCHGVGDLSISSSLTAAATPGRYRHGQRRRRMSVPLLLPLEGSGERVADRERRRPWTISHGEALATENVLLDEEIKQAGATVQPFRYSIRRLGRTHSEEIRLSDLRVHQPPLLGMMEAVPNQASASQRQDDMQGSARHSVSGNSTPAQAGNVERRSNVPEGIADDAQVAARSHAVTRQDQSGVHCTPTSDQGGSVYVPKGGGGGEVIRFGVEQEIVPRLASASSPGLSPWPSTSAVQLSSGEGSSPLQPHASYTSTLSAPSRRASGSGSRSALATLRAEREAVEAEARQTMARAAPNLFPEILVTPQTVERASGSANGMRGPRGWVAGA